MPRFRRFGPGYPRRKHPLNSAIWLVGLGILFYTHHIWPGILILIGISLILSTVWKESEPQTYNKPDFERPSSPPAQVITPAPAPNNAGPRADLLPSNCPRCGAPVRLPDVKWIGAQAACTYCGSTLPVQKS